MKIKKTNICAYCGTCEGETILLQNAPMKVRKNLSIRQDRVYFLKVCPACNTVIGTIEGSRRREMD